MVSTGAPDWFVFMSPMGASLLFKALKNRGSLLKVISEQSRILAVGQKTKSSLERLGVMKVRTPEDYSSDGVADFLSKTRLPRSRVFLARSAQASDTLARKLRQNGATVSTIRLYDSAIPTDSNSVSKFLNKLRFGRIDATLFTSSLSATNLFKMSRTKCPKGELRKLLRSCLVGAIGSTTADRLGKLGIRADLVPNRYLIDQAVTVLADTVKNKGSATIPV